MSYYNTTHLSGEELKQAVKSAEKQEAAVLILFQNTDRSYSPSQVMNLMEKAGWNCSLTSWRRAITNLTDKGVLQKTDEQIKGLYGKPEFKWKAS